MTIFLFFLQVLQSEWLLAGLPDQPNAAEAEWGQSCHHAGQIRARNDVS